MMEFLYRGAKHTFGRLTINLAKHDVERSDDGGNVGDHVPSRQEIHRLQMGKGWMVASATQVVVWMISVKVPSPSMFAATTCEELSPFALKADVA